MVTHLIGKYERVNEPFLRQQANRDDPRHIFYKAMLEHDTYEAYLAAVRGLQATTGTRKYEPTNGRDEMLYARQRGWIADAS